MKNKLVRTVQLFIILILLSLLSCDQQTTQKSPLIKDKASINNLKTNHDKIYQIKGEDSLNFQFIVDESKSLLKTIIINSRNKIIQEIEANKEIEGHDFQLIDWNFDNYKDITVLSNCGSGGCSYWIWKYSPKNKKYEYNNVLSGYIGLELDSISKYIIFHYRNGWQEESWDTFKYQNNKLMLEKSVHQERWNDSLNGMWIKKTHKNRVNNKLIKGVIDKKVEFVQSLPK